MKTNHFVIELEGRRVLVDQKRQRVCVLDAEGAAVFNERIQVAAGSVQGIFSAIEDVTGAKNV